ncbi:hypothetical protein SUGI_0569040 [Cryptomeria japonica]|nr:hypothetical protein SUGI_0569040 [Cryptomeria japonica]
MGQHKFALFIDDVWERGAELLEGLGVTLPRVCNSNCESTSSAIIVSSRNSSTLLQMGIGNSSTVQMQQLIEYDSWQLFLSQAFPYNNGKLPTTIKEETARGICRECGGLPLALKVTGKAMAGITGSEGWEITLKKLRNAESFSNRELADSLYSRLRVSYDALARHGFSLQLCFLYLAAFVEDKVLITATVSSIWFGEGLLDKHDPFQHGQANVDLLANRCLIEPIQRDVNGQVLSFRVHDVLYTLARQIAQMEENCFFHSGRGLEEFPANECSDCVRISLTDNKLRCVPNTFRGPHIRSLLLCGNPDLKEIPKQVVGSMTFLRVLDLSNTCIMALPENIGCLKHLVSLNLSSVPITRLPNSITTLNNLQMLHLYRSYIRELPSNIHKMSSLRVLDISFCKKLHSLPYGISQLKSMELLKLRSSPNVWVKSEQSKRRRDSFSINDLSALKQVKWLQLSNNGETIQERTLGSMMQMESLHLDLTKMESLPHDIIAMSRLRKLWLTCPQLLKTEHTFSGFQHLIYIKFMKCYMLKQLPDLHKLVRLKQLDIVRCTNIENLPKEFGENGAFPMLETFSLVCLDKLEELPRLEEEAMPSLKVFSLVLCEALQMLPENYWNLKSLDKIRVYGCSAVLKRIEENHLLRSSKVQILTLSAADTIASVKRMETILLKREHWLFGEFWSNELFHFLYKTSYVIFD